MFSAIAVLALTSAVCLVTSQRLDSDSERMLHNLMRGADGGVVDLSGEDLFGGEGVDHGEGGQEEDIALRALSRLTPDEIKRMIAGMEAGLRYNYQGQVAQPGEITFTVTQLKTYITSLGGSWMPLAPLTVPPVTEVAHTSEFTLEKVQDMITGMLNGKLYNYMGHEASEGERTLTMSQLEQFLNELLAKGPQHTADFTRADLERMLLGMQNGISYNYQGQIAQAGELTLTLDQINAMLAQLRAKGMGSSAGNGQGGLLQTASFTIDDIRRMKEGMQRGLKYNYQGQEASVGEITLTLQQIVEFEAELIRKGMGGITGGGMMQTASFTLDDVRRMKEGMQRGLKYNYQGQEAAVGEITLTIEQLNVFEAELIRRGMGGQAGGMLRTASFTMDDIRRMKEGMQRGLKYNYQGQEAAVGEVTLTLVQLDELEAELIRKGMGGQAGGMLRTASFTIDDIRRMKEGMQRGLKYNYQGQEATVGEITLTLVQLDEFEAELIRKGMVGPTGAGRAMQTASFTIDDIRRMKLGMQQGKRYNYQGQEASLGEITLSLEQLNEFEAELIRKGMGRQAGRVLQTASFTIDDIRRMKEGMRQGAKYNFQGQEAAAGEVTLTLEQLNKFELELLRNAVTGGPTREFTMDDLERMLAGIQRGEMFNLEGSPATVGDPTLNEDQLRALLQKLQSTRGMQGTNIVDLNPSISGDGSASVTGDFSASVVDSKTVTGSGQTGSELKSDAGTGSGTVVTVEGSSSETSKLVVDAKTITGPGMTKSGTGSDTEARRVTVATGPTGTTGDAATLIVDAKTVTGLEETRSRTGSETEARRVTVATGATGTAGDAVTLNVDAKSVTGLEVTRSETGSEPEIRRVTVATGATGTAASLNVDAKTVNGLEVTRSETGSEPEIRRVTVATGATGTAGDSAKFTVDTKAVTIPAEKEARTLSVTSAERVAGGFTTARREAEFTAPPEIVTPRPATVPAGQLNTATTVDLTRTTVSREIIVTGGATTGINGTPKALHIFIGGGPEERATRNTSEIVEELIARYNYSITQIVSMLNGTREGKKYNTQGVESASGEESFTIELLEYLLNEVLTRAFPNIAKFKKAEVSSVYSPDWSADKAVDGNPNQDMAQNSCFHTGPDMQPYFLLDLGAVYDIKGLRLFNRMDCCDDRLKNVMISVGLTRDTLRSMDFLPGPLSSETTVPFTSLALGQFIKIEVLGNAPTFMHLCEVQAFGEYVRDDACKNTPCKNGGVCMNTGGPDNCACVGGWLGPYCTETDLCALNPCLNGGSCVNDPRAKRCKCARGWFGRNCEISIEELLRRYTYSIPDIKRMIDSIRMGVYFTYHGTETTAPADDTFDITQLEALLSYIEEKLTTAELNFTLQQVIDMLSGMDRGERYNFQGRIATEGQPIIPRQRLDDLFVKLNDQYRIQFARFTRDDIGRMLEGINQGKSYNYQGTDAGFGEPVLSAYQLRWLLSVIDAEDRSFLTNARFTIDDIRRLLEGMEKGVRYNYRGENATDGEFILTRPLLLRYLFQMSPADIDRALGLVIRSMGATLDDVNRMIRDTENGIFYNFLGQPAKPYEDTLTLNMLRQIYRHMVDQDENFLNTAKFTVSDIARIYREIEDGRKINYQGELAHIGDRILSRRLLMRYLFRQNEDDIQKLLYILIRVSNFTIDQVRRMITDTENGMRYNFFAEPASPGDSVMSLGLLRQILQYLTDTALPNVAKFKKAEISSAYTPFWSADKAVDGNTDQDMDQNSCFHTREDKEPYFLVDLGAVYDIKRLRIFNRQDCCGERLKNVQISTGLTRNSLQETNFIPGPLLPETSVPFTAPTQAQFLRIQVKDVTPAFMHLCEVQVFGSYVRDDACKDNPCQNGGICQNTGGPDNCACVEWWTGLNCSKKGSRNIAYQKPASMSSLYRNDVKYAAAKGVDGDKTTDLASGACFSTDLERNPSWSVDLGAVYELEQIKLTNRLDCCTDRARNIEILGGITKNNMARIYELTGELGPERTLPISPGTEAQFITIQMRTLQPEYLHLCEVEIHGKYLRPDQCGVLACLNGGTCTNRGNIYNCACPPGFSGSRCQIDESKLTETLNNKTSEKEPDWMKFRVDPAACRRHNCNLPICYIPYDNDCKSYVVCQRTVIGSFVAWRMRCAFGSYWGTGKSYTCERVEDLALQGYTCPNDPCADRALVTYPDEDESNCRTYWKCENGVSRPTCCPHGERFDRITRKCERDIHDTCRTPCPLRVAGCAPGQPTQPFYDGNCRTYWDCEKGHPHPVCCPDGMAYDFFKGHCQPDVTCTDQCPQEYRERTCGKIINGQRVESYSLQDGNCRTYMKCATEGYDDPHCCRQDFRYDSLTGRCVRVEDMNSKCHIETCPPGYKEECRFSPVDNPSQFYDNDADLVRDCAPGTTFAAHICTCDGTAFNDVCIAEVWVKFDNLEDQRNIINYGDGAVSKYGDLTKNISDLGIMYGTFDGSSGIEVWRYDHTALPEVTLEVTFQPVDNGRRDRQVLVSNCRSVDNGEPSFEVTLDPVRSLVIFHGKSKFDAIELAVPYNKNTWNTYKIFFNGEHVVAVVEDPAGIATPEIASGKLRGEIVSGVGALKFGPCLDSFSQPKDDGFTGFMSEVVFSKCVDVRTREFIHARIKPEPRVLTAANVN